MRKYHFPLLTALAAIFLLTGCNDNTTGSATVKDSLCTVEDWSPEATAKCVVGEIVAFLPNSFGNEQLPIIAASALCDFRHPIATTNGGVVCVYTRKRMENYVAKTKAEQASSEPNQSK